MFSIFFNNLIFTQGKKFAKPELKSSIEEFEDKINKLHIEKKDQELTAQNAQSHKQRVESLGSFVITKKEGEESGESEIAEGKKNHMYTRNNTLIISHFFIMHIFALCQLMDL